VSTSTTTNIIWTDLDVNWGLHSEKQATNCLSYGMVFDLGEISLKFYILGVKQGLSALPEEDRLKIFENILLRGIFRPKRQAVTKGCKTP
jgi:hypothetical protein